VTEPRDGAPDDLEQERIDDEGASALEEGALDEIDDDAIVTDLEADVDAQVDDYDAALREVAGEEPSAVPPPGARPGAPSPRRRPTAPAQRAPSPSEIAVHVREDWSKAFVIITAAVYIGILLYGLLFGHGGFFTPLATPTPIPTEEPSASPGASPSGSAAPSPSPAATASASPS
jgi:hypothetical protein